MRVDSVIRCAIQIKRNVSRNNTDFNKYTLKSRNRSLQPHTLNVREKYILLIYI